MDQGGEGIDFGHATSALDIARAVSVISLLTAAAIRQLESVFRTVCFITIAAAAEQPSRTLSSANNKRLCCLLLCSCSIKAMRAWNSSTLLLV